MKQTDKILTLDPGPSQLISAICDEINLEAILNEQLVWDKGRCHLSPGSRLKALIINILCDRQPLYHIHEFFETQDVEMLFGNGITAEDLNEYCIGRSLDALYKATPWKVYSTLAISACKKLGLPIGTLHNDTTSFSLYGSYIPEEKKQEGTDKVPVHVTYGYSKQHRPDLKQIVLGMGVTPDRIPIMAKVEDGNTDDKGWNLSFIKNLREILSEDDWNKIVYQADSALITTENLRDIRGKLHFISRLPETFKLCNQLKEEAWENDDWQEVGPLKPHKGAAAYKIQSYVRKLDDYPYRFVVIYSNNLNDRKEHTLQRSLEKGKIQLEKAIQKFEATVYYCISDAEKALAEFQKTHSSPFLTYKLTVQPEEQTEKRAKRGRPKKEESLNTFTVYRPCLQYLEEDSEAIKEKKQKMGTFVLITDLVNTTERPDVDILRTYKGQEAAETRFRLLKSPQMIDGFFLKKPSRIEALGIVFVMALLIYGILEQRIRENMKKEIEPLVLAGRRKVTKPTAQVLLKELKNIKIIYIQQNGSTMRFIPDNVGETSKRILQLAGYDLSIYVSKKSEKQPN